MDTVQIIEWCKRKDLRYRKVLYEQFYGYALKIAFRYLYQYDAAKDVVNDGFVKLFRQFDEFTFKKGDSPEQLLAALIKRIIVDISVRELLSNKMNPEPDDIPEYVWEETNDYQKDDQALLYKELISHLKILPPVCRIVFNMSVIDGFTHFYIANTLDISVADSESTLTRARDILKMIVGKKIA